MYGPGFWYAVHHHEAKRWGWVPKAVPRPHLLLWLRISLAGASGSRSLHPRLTRCWRCAAQHAHTHTWDTPALATSTAATRSPRGAMASPWSTERVLPRLRAPFVTSRNLANPRTTARHISQISTSGCVEAERGRGGGEGACARARRLACAAHVHPVSRATTWPYARLAPHEVRGVWCLRAELSVRLSHSNHANRTRDAGRGHQDRGRHRCVRVARSRHAHARTHTTCACAHTQPRAPPRTHARAETDTVLKYSRPLV
jgi:hypothetical protein